MGNNYDHGFLDYPVFAFSEKYTHGHVEDWHSHDRIQLIHTLTGVIRVQTTEGTWVTPPGRGVWIPAYKLHALHISGDVQAYGVFIAPHARDQLVNQCRVVAISPLLKELIRHAMQVQSPIQAYSREHRLLELILDEVELLHVLPFNLPEPQNIKLKKLCDTIKNDLAQEWSLAHAAAFLHISPKTLTRHFQKGNPNAF
ncbi:MAG: HTH-type transcriptional regulator NimR [Acinetobacter bereziniae]|uniref:HTH-type transcriptional regulator NimR n=1 Tax=Acinetobacter bereziniae TaxID=106648 RepID=A0A833PHE5_ACIBZ|nr:MAG: HTH-type transcriptional regulator NimR [Acinetobacter bereziniae]